MIMTAWSALKSERNDFQRRENCHHDTTQMEASNSKKFRYADGQELLLGDIVIYGRETATVVADSASASYAAIFSREEWDPILAGGFLLEFENGALLRLEQCDEDTRLVRRKQS